MPAVGVGVTVGVGVAVAARYTWISYFAPDPGEAARCALLGVAAGVPSVVGVGRSNTPID